MIKKKLIFIIFLTCFSAFLKAQKPFLAANISTHTGFIIPHSESIRSISNSNPWIIETGLSWHFSDSNAWNYCSCYPRIGISLFYINYNNPEILGNGFAAIPYVEPFFSANRKFSLSVRFGAGYIYLDNVFDPEKNPLNLFYSTHSSFLLMLNFALNYRLAPKWNARLSANYNHVSNGGNRLPNKGINFPTASIGIDYLLVPVNFPSGTKIEKSRIEKRSFIKAGIMATLKKPFPEEGSRYLLYGVFVNWDYLLGRLSAISGGIEYVNDQAVKEELSRKYSSPPDHQRISFLGGHNLYVGRFRFSQQLGIYIYSPFKAKDPVYQRYGLDFQITKKLYAGINLKAHRHVADFMDFRIGVVF